MATAVANPRRYDLDWGVSPDGASGYLLRSPDQPSDHLVVGVPPLGGSGPHLADFLNPLVADRGVHVCAFEAPGSPNIPVRPTRTELGLHKRARADMTLLANLVERMRPKHMTLFGHSIGTAVLSVGLPEFSARFRSLGVASLGLVMVAPPIGRTPSEYDLARGSQLSTIVGKFAACFSSVRAFGARRLSTTLGPNELQRRYFRSETEVALLPSYVDMNRGIDSSNVLTRLFRAAHMRLVDGPIVFVLPETDRWFPKQTVMQNVNHLLDAAALPRSIVRFDVVAPGGHALIDDAPDEVRRIIASHCIPHFQRASAIPREDM